MALVYINKSQYIPRYITKIHTSFKKNVKLNFFHIYQLFTLNQYFILKTWNITFYQDDFFSCRKHKLNCPSESITVTNAQCTQTDFLYEGLIFYWGESVPMDRLFIAEKTSDLPFFIGVSFGAHRQIFYRSYCVWQWQARSHCWIKSLWFFIVWSQHTWTDFLS